ncbi:MAG: glycoside hydrolase family 2 [Clostridia bacterium]|nr:glycoside hydrolase family 2 [Clostridia bacterium]
MPKRKTSYSPLTTPFEKGLADVPYADYPRPSLRRDSYMTLNGHWSISVIRKKGEIYKGDILVPFPPESKISGVNQCFPYDAKLIYSRKFTLTEEFIKDRVILHFGAVDRYACVKINSKTVCEHNGGYLPFSVDITSVIIQGENTVEVEAYDDLDTDYPYGKQSKKRGGMWYTLISGIWQSVWLESVCENYIKGLHITADTRSVTVKVLGGERHKKLCMSIDGQDKEYNFISDSITVHIPNGRLWTPDDPYIYNFSVISGNDRVESYFALRTVSVGKRGDTPCMLLNGEPIFMHGLLDQGYFSDGIYLPATPEGYKNDILTMKRLGFNMLRKHIKIEPQLFYYYCDVYGMLIWQDMVNSGKYSFLIDTALPTVGLKMGIKHRASEKRREIFENTAKETIEHLHNHPSVVYYTIFNEGWGQYNADRIYGELKAVDPTRIYDATSGWFTEKVSDVESLHIYFKPVKIKKNPDRPVVLSEFGGYSYKIKEHSFNLDKTYGYKLFEDREEFEAAVEGLYQNEIIPAIDNGLCATVLTQVSDVEEETNGLFTYDRQVLKVREERMQNIAKDIYNTFQNKK